MQKLFERQQAEQQEKNARRLAATEKLKEWHADKTRQTEQRKKNNQMMEQNKIAAEQEERSGKNQWDRICNNIDINAQMSPGGRDLSRMKAAMLARRADMANGAASGFNF